MTTCVARTMTERELDRLGLAASCPLFKYYLAVSTQAMGKLEVKSGLAILLVAAVGARAGPSTFQKSMRCLCGGPRARMWGN